MEDKDILRSIVPAFMKKSFENDIPVVPAYMRATLAQVVAQPPRMGRPRINEKFPTLVSVVNNFVRDHGFAAHARRREITGSIGVSLQQIQEHCFENVPGLRDHGISLNTIHRLFHAPSRRTSAQQLYKNLVSARVADKSNCIARTHIDSHYCRSQVNYALQFVSRFSDEVIGISADAKEKLNMNGAAVSRLVGANCFMLTSDSIQLPDNDFAEPGYKLTPLGYMRLTDKRRLRTRSASPVRQSSRSGEFADDSTTRKLPRTGPLHLFLRGHMYNRDTAFTHHLDLLHVLQPIVETEKKKAVV